MFIRICEGLVEVRYGSYFSKGDGCGNDEKGTDEDVFLRQIF